MEEAYAKNKSRKMDIQFQNEAYQSSLNVQTELLWHFELFQKASLLLKDADVGLHKQKHFKIMCTYETLPIRLVTCFKNVKKHVMLN